MGLVCLFLAVNKFCKLISKDFLCLVYLTALKLCKLVNLLKKCSLIPSNGEGRRLIQQGGISLDDEKVTDVYASVPVSAFEKGLSFLEFNYMLMQSYDFLMLSRDYNCKLELGGDDQWSNMLGGTELIRRKLGKDAYAMTINLLLNSEGKKMGKTQSGAVWLSAEKTSPYDFYQYWRNVDDSDVIKCLKMLTFLPLEEIAVLEKLEGAEINKAKEVLAFEVTKLIHGEEEATKAQTTARAVFGAGATDENMPSTDITVDEINDGVQILDLLLKCGLISSKGEGRRLVQQNGIAVNDSKVSDMFMPITADLFTNNELVIKKGKKVYHKVNLV